MSFNESIERLLDDEGGYVDDPHDPGGETKYGISKRTYPALDIKALTREEAIGIYYRDWWVRNGYDQIKYSTIAEKIFNLAVNMGAKAAHKLVQRALWSVGKRPTIDGILGPHTKALINEQKNDMQLIAALRSEAAGHYRILVQGNSSLKKYIKGWIKRAYS